ncbi:PilZ domain-containing protein [Mesorhizobium sp. M0220]|uniref:PilZ domain-containing protein n=1 Tax=unclassified Mesorhizobium TaxID=325217 RepID=UPI0033378450
MDPTDPKPDRRLHNRKPVLKEATIITGRDLDISCSIRNQHERGAELRVAADASVPDRFVLFIPEDGAAYRAVVRWRKNDRLGVQLYGTGLVNWP